MHNLPASVEAASVALGTLADHTTEIADVLAMAFGLPFAPAPMPYTRYGTVTANVERLAGSLDAIARTAEAASARLLGLARPVQPETRPEVCHCEPAAETLTVPEDATDDVETDAISIVESGHHITTSTQPEPITIDSTTEEAPNAEKTTDDTRKDEAGESVIHRPGFPLESDPTPEDATGPEVEGTADRRRGRKTAKRKLA